MRKSRLAILAAGAFLLLGNVCVAQETLRLCDFETADDLKAWDVNSGSPALVAEGVTHDQKALQIMSIEALAANPGQVTPANGR